MTGKATTAGKTPAANKTGAAASAPSGRTASIFRETLETKVRVDIDLDGTGKGEISTGIGFFDHMLKLFACHSGFDLKIKCEGDTYVDGHHTVEDVGIVLGKAINAALGNKVGIARYADKQIPMDESLAEVAVDISGRAFTVFNADLSGKGEHFDYELVEEFFRALANAACITLHINLKYGKNEHHKAECIFKAFARTMRDAVAIVNDRLPSSKGTLGTP